MTGYGSSDGRVGEGVLFAEVRSINSRFLDINCKLPPVMYALESKIKKLIQNKLVRGKVEVFLKEKSEFAKSVNLVVNTKLVKEYKKCLGHVMAMIGAKVSSHLLEVVDLKDLVVSHETRVNIENYWKQMEAVINKAVLKLEIMRKKEGNAIKIDQLKRLKWLKGLCVKIEKRAGARLVEAKKKLEAVSAQSEQCSSLIDRLDITEELVRLTSHIQQYLFLIGKKNGVVGRQLDFLIQEMHREINTLGSKACDGAISNLVVEAKSEIEKLREQVQNIE